MTRSVACAALYSVLAYCTKQLSLPAGCWPGDIWSADQIKGIATLRDEDQVEVISDGKMWF